jgi:hypothetical protein
MTELAVIRLVSLYLLFFGRVGAIIERRKWWIATILGFVLPFFNIAIRRLHRG